MTQPIMLHFAHSPARAGEALARPTKARLIARCSAPAALLLAACSDPGLSAPAPVSALELHAALEARGDAADRLPIQLPSVADPMFSGLTVPADAPSKGMWSTTKNWPLNGLHSVLLPNGRVLTFGTPAGNPGAQDGRTFDTWDPAQGFGAASHQTSFRADQVNSFCSSATFLDNGRLLVSGGNSPFESSEVNPASSEVTKNVSRMADERWYATMLTLADGRPIIMGGSAPYGALAGHANPVAAINGGQVSMTPEVYEPDTGWRSLFGAQSREAFGPDHNRYWYPRAWIAPHGEVFGISSEKMWYLDPAGDGAVRVAGNFKTGADNVTKPNIGPTSSAVMFAPGRILQVGGNGYQDGYASPASRLATVIDINGSAPVLTEAAPMTHARHWPSATVLPDGRVLVTGGTGYANNGGADAVYAAEIWDPATDSWTLGAPAAQIRVYHSAAILLPNGTLLSTGGGAPGPVNNLNAEVYYPPYLFQAEGNAAVLAPRPLMTAISALSFDPGDQVEVEMADAAPVSKVVLIGTSSVTHSFNTSQRYNVLDFEQSGSRIVAALPENANLAPHGYYQLMVLSDTGVPSPSAIIALGAAAAPPVPTALPRGNPVTLLSVSRPDHALATDAGGFGVLQALSTDPTPAELATATFIVRDGLADSRCVSLESTANPGQWLRHDAERLRLAVSDGSAALKAAATFCSEPGLSGTGLTLRSKNVPGSVLHHRNGELWIDAVVADDSFADEASFRLRVIALPTLPEVPAPLVPVDGTAEYAPDIDAPDAEYSWDFGDGSAPTAFDSSPAATHTFESAGVYLITLTLRMPDGRTRTKTFVQAVHGTVAAGSPRASSAMLLETRASASARLWVVNPDNASVSVFDTAGGQRLAEITVGLAPRSLAQAPNGRVWVVARDSRMISMIDPATLKVARTLAMPAGSQPFGVVFAPDSSAAFVSLEGAGQVLKLQPSSGAQLGSVAVGAAPRHLSISANSSQLLVSRFITPPLPGESTAFVQTSTGGVEHGGELVVVSPSTLQIAKTVVLRHSEKSDNSVQGRGIPNYLGPAVIAPDGASAWLPSKQDNVLRGTLRDGLNLDYQNTVRAISSRIDLGALAEDYARRVDHDNASVASAAAFHPTGAYLFVALETSRQVAVLDAAGGKELFRIDVGRAPQAVAVSASGTELYVQNFLDRSVSVISLDPLLSFGTFSAPLLATWQSVQNERLSAQVFLGKQLFYDARDPRLSRDAYLSCASCHADGAHDGRVWDITGMGEGLRNTIGLRGRSGGTGLLHWSRNFDEVQDFEGQIRSLSGGTGLMSDTDFENGTRSLPLGDRKTGISADLDALAAYVQSLSRVAESPFRGADGSLTAAGAAGRLLFASSGCISCHHGSTYSDEGGSEAFDVGTLRPSSGSRLGGPLTGVTAPTLREAWTTAPYLHDGSAATLSAAILAHTEVALTPAELADLSAFVQQIDASEPGFAPSGLEPCAEENGTCNLPIEAAATVYFGAGQRYFSRSLVTGSIACNVEIFGDPAPGESKTCLYR
jgi:YVTN family beta-propeller protein